MKIQDDRWQEVCQGIWKLVKPLTAEESEQLLRDDPKLQGVLDRLNERMDRILGDIK